MASEDYTVKVVVNAAGETNTVLNRDLLEYTPLPFNEWGKFKFVINAADNFEFSRYDQWKDDNSGTVYIYRKGVLELKGIIRTVKTNSTGKLVVSGEGWGAQAKMVNVGDTRTDADYITSPSLFKIFSDINTKISAAFTPTIMNYTESVAETNTLDAVVLPWQSCDKVLKSVASDYAKDSAGDRMDFYVTYSDSGTDTMYSTDHRGSITSIGAFVDGLEVQNVSKEINQEIYNDITVIGRGYGTQLVTGNYTDGDDGDTDGSSITLYGHRSPTTPIVNKSLADSAACVEFAKGFVIRNRFPPEPTKLKISDVDSDFTTGDEFTLNSAQNNIIPTYAGDVPNPNFRISRAVRRVRPGSDELFWTISPTLKDYIRPGFTLSQQRRIDAGLTINQGVDIDIAGQNKTQGNHSTTQNKTQSGHYHDVTGITTDLDEFLGNEAVDNNSNVSVSATSLTNVAQVNAPTTADKATQGHQAHVIVGYDSDPGVHLIRVYNSTTSALSFSAWYPAPASLSYDTLLNIPIDQDAISAGDTFILYFYATNACTIDTTLTIHLNKKHSHGVTGKTTSTEVADFTGISNAGALADFTGISNQAHSLGQEF